MKNNDKLTLFFEYINIIFWLHWHSLIISEKKIARNSVILHAHCICSAQITWFSKKVAKFTKLIKRFRILHKRFKLSDIWRCVKMMILKQSKKNTFSKT
jgi:hypothetical protein